MAEYVSKIVVGSDSIDLTGDSAKEANVLSGYTFHRNDGKPTTGTCTYDSDTSDATAESAEVLNGETFYARGQKQTGSMPNRGKQTGYITDVDTPVQIQNGFHDGSGSIGISAADAAKLKDHSNIKSGVTILGQTGEYSGEGATAESKTVTPSFSEQTILPTGADYLSQVKVNPIPVTRVLNASGGYTVTVG